MYHPDLIRHPDSCPALVLNADYTPLSYYPLSLWPWQTAVKAAFLERVDIIAEYDREIHSPSFTMRIPSVIALRQYVRPAAHPAFTRFNLFLRDRFRCQYCGAKDDLTFDHVIPRSLGGRTPAQAHMALERRPERPSSWELQEHGRGFPPNFLHETWRDYLYWDIELLA